MKLNATSPPGAAFVYEGDNLLDDSFRILNRPERVAQSVVPVTPRECARKMWQRTKKSLESSATLKLIDLRCERGDCAGRGLTVLRTGPSLTCLGATRQTTLNLARFTGGFSNSKACFIRIYTSEPRHMLSCQCIRRMPCLEQTPPSTTVEVLPIQSLLCLSPWPTFELFLPQNDNREGSRIRT